MPIWYRSGYKYQLSRPYIDELVVFRVTENALNAWTMVYPDPDGSEKSYIAISKGYAWDGASGPAMDTPTIMRGALVHDALYQLIRDGHLPEGARRAADDEMYWTCRADGMSSLRAWYVLQAVHYFAGGAAKAVSSRPELQAP